MFTGIIQEMGEVMSHSRTRLAVRVRTGRGRIGDSVAVNGICLTIVREQGKAPKRDLFFDLSTETLERTAVSELRPRTIVNVEHPLRLQDELGGHLVQGHVDTTGKVLKIDADKAGGKVIWISTPTDLERYLVAKGSVTVDGVSLTVAKIAKGRFAVALIPHTLTHSTMGTLIVGAKVNLEADVIAKYVAKYTKRS